MGWLCRMYVHIVVLERFFLACFWVVRRVPACSLVSASEYFKLASV